MPISAILRKYDNIRVYILKCLNLFHSGHAQTPTGNVHECIASGYIYIQSAPERQVHAKCESISVMCNSHATPVAVVCETTYSRQTWLAQIICCALCILAGL